MSYRRRHRWFRRLALGLALAAAVSAGRVSVAAATVGEGTSAGPHATAASGDPYRSDVFVRPGESRGGPDGRPVHDAAAPSDARATDSATAQVETSATRPDDRADRFAASDVVSQPELASSGWASEWKDPLTLGVGAVIVALGLGLALGYLRRPRLAGL